MKKLTEVDSLSTEAALVLGTKEVIVEQPAPRLYNSTSVKLQSLIDAHVLYTGKVTSRQYEWARAGSIVAVDSLDAPTLLEKRIKTQSCCSESDVAVFQKID
jgi:hypothetical protein